MRKALRWLPWLYFVVAMPALALPPESWKRTAYAYDAQQAELMTALGDFAREFGLALDMPPMDGVIDGRIRADNPQGFLDRLGREYHFQWFVFNETLYVSPTQEQTSARIDVSSEAVDDLEAALSKIGLLDPRFGWGLLPDEGAVLVRGPAKYVQFIRDYGEKVEEPEEAEKQDVIVFPLKYANVADRTIRYRDQELQVAGVARILQELLDARAQTGMRGAVDAGASLNGLRAGAGSRDSSSLVQDALANSGLEGSGYGPDLGAMIGLAPVPSSSGKSRERGGKIRVSADVRNNAVLIYDLPARKAMYQGLIAQLDVPRNVIEIDAVILDIDRNELAELSSRWSLTAGSVTGGANLLQPGAPSTLFIQDAGRFSADLRALEGNGAASIVGNPSILTLENQPAVIDFSRTEYLTALAERVANIAPITAGTSLQVIPRSLNHNGRSQVQLIVDIEDGQIVESQIKDEQPSVRRGNVSTQAVIAEHGSLVIGGFHGVEANDRLNKVPLLGDIPVIGKLLFQSRSREYTQRERLFILTPRLIGDQVNPARYVQHANPHDLDRQLKEVQARRGVTDRPTRNDVRQAFENLVAGTLPQGFSAARASFQHNTLCRFDPGLTVNAEHSQWFVRKDWGVAVVAVRNDSDMPMRIDESQCGGRWVLGVSAWPQAWLQPGEQSEVFIAMRQAKALDPSLELRPSLLSDKEP
ncbi:EscC/YscC/HrcC family type III secretion system outer membrane ring protein [Pseudomonas sp. PA15(2017)]|uniref:type III secretion system outer membrane ring subunit SctC n=1 Tax=Pseudomonas sp. PA15(2017) TaxID=1932111 RepID=UPI0009657E70|nr:type III secretion system outer membrane ring subunit SctC [Pseudomonas sp. PA15(2017)]OLU33676.1 EscC/YscC/HrcC family type III secretion system outer membrane ring protein [Pseudomonas sp. PA15(2017)]